MIIYKDCVSGDEMISDTFKLELVDNIAWKVSSFSIKKGGETFDIGANASAEGEDADAGADDQVEMVNNVVDAFRLQQMGMTKKSFMGYLKDWLKKVKAHLEATEPARVADFQTQAQAFIKEKILPVFDDFTFYCGVSMDPDGGMALMFYEGENPNPFFYFFKDSLIPEKC